MVRIFGSWRMEFFVMKIRAHGKGLRLPLDDGVYHIFVIPGLPWANTYILYP
jgi:hypothetical protein